MCSSDLYYLGPDGAMFTNTHTINDRTYTFDESGVWQPCAADVSCEVSALDTDSVVCSLLSPAGGVVLVQALNAKILHAIKANILFFIRTSIINTVVKIFTMLQYILLYPEPGHQSYV